MSTTFDNVGVSRCLPQSKPFLDINQFIESDNPGSTDSEVRKILTLHIPITEYDTLGSESDNDMASRSNQSNYRHHRGKCTLLPGLNNVGTVNWREVNDCE